MGEKVDGLLSVEKVMGGEDPRLRLLGEFLYYLRLEETTASVFQAADEVQHLKNLKPLMDRMSEALNEQLKLRIELLRGDMMEDDLQNFARNGQSFYLTSQSLVQAKKELGGTANPQLIEWLEEQDMGEIAKLNVHANTLTSNVNEWIKNHPIDAVVDGSPLEGDDLLEYLDLTLEEFEERVAAYDRLNELVTITNLPTVGMRKA